MMKRVWRWLDQPRRLLRRQVVNRCSACEAPLYYAAWPKRWGDLLSLALWVAVCNWTFPDRMPILPMFALMIPMLVAWAMAENRIYHHYWLWKHPLRCGGGHVQPAPSAA